MRVDPSIAGLATAPAQAQKSPTSRGGAFSAALAQASATTPSGVSGQNTQTQQTASTDAAKKAPKAEKTRAVEGHAYSEVIAGPRNGMFVNTSGNKRDGMAFVMVKREGREFHVYGTGRDRLVVEVKHPPKTATPAPAATEPAATTPAATAPATS